MTRQRTKRCGTCRHWREHKIAADGGECVVDTDLARLSGLWPKFHTMPDFGCVEWTSNVDAQTSARDKSDGEKGRE